AGRLSAQPACRRGHIRNAHDRPRRASGGDQRSRRGHQRAREMIPDPHSADRPREIEPAAGPARAPVWLFVLMAVLAFWGMGFLDKNGGGFDARVYGPYKSYAELDNDQPRLAKGPDPKKGRVAFGLFCAACHQESGLGNPANNVPPLVHSEWVLAEGPNRLIRIVLNGLQGPVK